MNADGHTLENQNSVNTKWFRYGHKNTTVKSWLSSVIDSEFGGVILDGIQ